MQLTPEQTALLDSTTVDQHTMEAHVYLLKDKLGVGDAKTVMEVYGGRSKLMDIPPEKYKAVIDACKNLLRQQLNNPDKPAEDDQRAKPKPGRNAISAAIARNTETVQTHMIKGRIAIDDIEKLLIEQFDLPFGTKFDWCYSESQQELLHLEIEHVEQVKLKSQ